MLEQDRVDGAALVRALRDLPVDKDASLFVQKRIFDRVDALNDPGAADELLRFLATKPHPYFETRAALALSALGDLRSVPYLAQRLLRDPLTTYGESDFELMLKRDDNERVAAARRLADLSFLHPAARAELLKQVEGPLLHWLRDRAAPHGNGLRALAALGSTRAIADFRTWSNPSLPLPEQGDPPPMSIKWVIAQMTLRYVGVLHDEPSWTVLLGALTRRPPKLDLSMDNLPRANLSLLGMTLRAIGVGAAEGLSEWRDARAFAPLLAYVRDAKNNEGSRLSACNALAWVGSDADLRSLATKLVVPKPDDAAGTFLAACLLGGLRQRPAAGVAAALLPLLTERMPAELRNGVARAMGQNALGPPLEASLKKLFTRPTLANDAALALMLGGTPEGAVSAVKATQGNTATLEEAWRRSFDFWSVEDVANGTLFRVMENAEALAKLRNRDQSWAQRALASELGALQFDNGPHSATRVVLDHQLMTLARGGDERRAELAIRALGLVGDAGMLLALSRESGPRAKLAQATYDELLARPIAEPPLQQP